MKRGDSRCRGRGAKGVHFRNLEGDSSDEFDVDSVGVYERRCRAWAPGTQGSDNRGVEATLGLQAIRRRKVFVRKSTTKESFFIKKVGRGDGFWIVGREM